MLKRWVRDRGKISPAKPLAVIARLLLVVMGGEGEFSVLAFGSIETGHSIKSRQECNVTNLLVFSLFHCNKFLFLINLNNYRS